MERLGGVGSVQATGIFIWCFDLKFCEVDAKSGMCLKLEKENNFSI